MRKIILAVAVAALATMAVASSAFAGVDRYQAATGLTVTGTFNGTPYVHTYNLISQPGGSFTGTGGMTDLGLTEHISGTLDGQNIVIDSTYDNYNPGFWWHYNGPLSGGGTYDDPQHQAVTVTAEVTTTTFKNHGDYVSYIGGGSEAAHSPIGMPVH